MRVVAGSDWVIDIGPGAGEEGGRVVASGTPADIAKVSQSRTAPYLARFLERYVTSTSMQSRRPNLGTGGSPEVILESQPEVAVILQK